MPELLLELLTEEIPARMQMLAVEDLRRLAFDRFKTAGIEPQEIRSFVTPRRMVLVADGLPSQQPEVNEERRGPRVGAPPQAIDGFLKSAGLASTAELEQRDTGKGVFYFATIRRPGRATADVLPELLRSVVLDFPWPKSMRFPAARFRWVRPLTSALCLFDGKVLPLDLDGVPVGNETRGHRFLSSGTFAARDFAEYRAKLEAAHVMLDQKKRRQAIELALYERAAEAQVTVKDDQALLDEVTGLVEWPVVLIGAIDPGFLDLPPEVLTTSMRAHLKYFSCLDRDGKLAPRFLVVANMLAEDGGKTIIAGNERVLRARLSDARFFWDQDRKIRLEHRVPKLQERVFHAKLGTMLAKADRVARLAGTIADYVGADRANALRATKLAKADLSSGMVGEFPELQGVMGRYYALAEGEPSDVADAIAEHYSPLGPNDRCPSAPVSIAVALADKIDSLVGFFLIRETPTGSKDPFALRRAALGVIRLIIENTLRINLRVTFKFACEAYTDPAIRLQMFRNTESGVEYSYSPIVAGLLGFFADRLKVHLREKGVRHDLIAAIFARGDEDDLVRLLARVAALDAFLRTEDGANLLVAYRRAANIVRIEEKKDGKSYPPQPDSKLLEEPAEKRLAVELERAAAASRAALGREAFTEAMAALAALRGPVDEFFTRVTVNCENREFRANRLRLLAKLRDTFDAVAAFSEIEG